MSENTTSAETARQDYIPLSVQRRNLWVVVLDGVAVGLMAAGGAFVSVFVVRLGASALWVSLLTSVPSAVGLLMAIPWSRFAERQTRPERVFAWARLAVHGVYLLVSLVPFLLRGEAAARAVVIVWSLSSLSGSLSNMMFTLVMGRAVPPERRAFLMSRRWMFLGIAKLISLPLASQLIDRLPFPQGYQIVYGANFVIALAAFACATQIRVPQKETSKVRVRHRARLGGLGTIVSELAQAKSFVVFVVGRSGLNLGLALVSAIVPIYWVSHLNASDTWVGYFTFTLSAATLVSYPLWTRLRRRYGTKWILISSVLGSALYPALLSLTRSPSAVLLVVAFNGAIGGGLNLAFFDALLDTCPREKEERFVAINLTAVNLMGVVAPPIGAALLGMLPIRRVMWIGTLVALGGVAVFVFANTGRRGSQAAHQGHAPPKAAQPRS